MCSSPKLTSQWQLKKQCNVIVPQTSQIFLLEITKEPQIQLIRSTVIHPHTNMTIYYKAFAFITCLSKCKRAWPYSFMLIGVIWIGGKVKGHQIDSSIKSFEPCNQTCHIFSISIILANDRIIMPLKIEFIISIMNHYWLFGLVREGLWNWVHVCVLMLLLL